MHYILYGIQTYSALKRMKSISWPMWRGIIENLRHVNVINARKLSKSNRKRVKKLSAILRIADGLDRSHYQNVQQLEIENKSDAINLLIMTQADPELEIWGTLRKAELLEKITKKKIRVFQMDKR